MTTLQKLELQRGDVAAKVNAIITKANAESRTLDEKEDQEVKTLTATYNGIGVQIEALKLVGEPVPEPAPSGGTNRANPATHGASGNGS